MRISVIGMGAVGGTLAAAWAGAGHAVTAVARGDSLRRLQRTGLQVDGKAVPVDLAEAPAADGDLVVIAVRAFDVPTAVAAYVGTIGEQPVLVVANGLEAPEQTVRALNRCQGVFGGLALFPATRRNDGTIVRTGPGGLRIGAHDPGEGGLAERLSAALTTSSIHVRAVASLAGALWMKLLLNEVNTLPALTNTSVQFVARQPLLAPIFADALAETVRVADALRIPFASIGSLTPAHVAMIRRGRADVVVTGRIAHLFGARPNPASMLQSLRQGRVTEADALIGAVVRAGAKAGVATPVHEALLRAVQAAELDSRFLHPALLSQLLRRTLVRK